MTCAELPFLVTLACHHAIDLDLLRHDLIELVADDLEQFVKIAVKGRCKHEMCDLLISDLIFIDILATFAVYFGYSIKLRNINSHFQAICIRGSLK